MANPRHALRVRLNGAPAPHANVLARATENARIGEAGQATMARILTEKYPKWRKKLVTLCAADELDTAALTKALQSYKNDLDLAIYSTEGELCREAGQLKVGSTVLEEFFTLLLTRVANDSGRSDLTAGPVRALTGVSIDAEGRMVASAKDVDAAIYREVRNFEGVRHSVIGLECKTNLDKTMLEGISSTAEAVKGLDPTAAYSVIAEWRDMASKRPAGCRVDDIFVLRGRRPRSDERLTALTYRERMEHRDEYIAFLASMPFREKVVDWFVKRSQGFLAPAQDGGDAGWF